MSKFSIPEFGLGTWKIPKSVAANVVYETIKLGVRHIDCACDYGNEVEVGLGIKQAISEGIVKREDLFITSKLWNTYHRKEHVLPAAQRSLHDLGIDYFDLCKFIFIFIFYDQIIYTLNFCILFLFLIYLSIYLSIY